MSKKSSFMANIIRYLGLWFSFSTIYAMFAVCPFCGQMGCPVGAGSAGFVGGMLALLMRIFFGKSKKEK